MPHREALDLILQTSLDAVVVIDAVGTVTAWNDAAERVFGWSRAEAIGSPMGPLIIPAHLRPAHEAGMKRFLETGQGPVLRRRIEITALRRSGEEFPIELIITPMGPLENLQFLASIRDISPEKALLRTLERRATEAGLLHQVAAAASETRSLDEIVALALSAVCSLLSWPIGHAFLIERDRLVGHSWHGDLADHAFLVAVTDARTFQRGEGLPGRVWESAAPEWIADCDNTSFIRGNKDDLGVASAFAVPIVTLGEVVAVLEFFSPAPRPPDPDLIRSAQTIGAQLGRAVERQREAEHQSLLMSELAHRTKNLMAIISSLVSQTSRGATSLKSYVSELQGRLSSLATAQTILVRSQWEPTSLHVLVRDVVGLHCPPDDQPSRCRALTP
ncbi:PAS domain S-box protein [Brevundimonas sp.]|uniref:PAS domain S-box protein n=1 Tax=Brevundimonas sp. TaxID=1871086 RepID=UPI0025E7FC9A|nr:PAS domain S-box protein [Brevundimonas sp.]